VARLLITAAAAAFLVLAGPASAASLEPWKAAADVRTTLAEAQRALVLGEPAKARKLVAEATALQLGVLGPAAQPGLAAAGEASEAKDPVALEVARAATWTAVLAEAVERATAAAAAGDVDQARAWLLVREFRKPTRFTRPGADGTLALQGLAERRLAAGAAAAAVRADLLDTYQARLRASLEAVTTAAEQGFDVSRAGAAALARGYFATLAAAYAGQRSPAEARAAAAAFDELVAAAQAGNDAGVEAAQAEIDAALEGFRTAPLSEAEELRRAGQLLRFLALVPIEYGRGVKTARSRSTSRSRRPSRSATAPPRPSVTSSTCSRSRTGRTRGGSATCSTGWRRTSALRPGAARSPTPATSRAPPTRRSTSWTRSTRRSGRERARLRTSTSSRPRWTGSTARWPPASSRRRSRRARGLRPLRVRAGAAVARSRQRPLRGGRGPLLVRRRRLARPRAAREAQGRPG
jgi:hypothetical protein